ncbi:citrulline utilization hydrolase CtlX [Anditalea andensis]|uniref:Amidinotransferase n=1 Tax=Anditalea andensis TaxID=1048983 RepID=A0A074KYY1_9BACT|nr:arginine deiminase-related protein [Anditalea andensis]KEO75176.1 amidinotransferase [Anditalea andensis]
MPETTSSTLLMVRPANFGFNPETAASNFYQQQDERPVADLHEIARQEFDGFVDMLRSYDIKVIVVEDIPVPVKSDAVFPNNWFSTHEDGRLVLYPMASPSRRLERRSDIVNILAEAKFTVDEIVDLSFFEDHDQFLEGTGSVILDRENQVMYAGLSERTHKVPLQYLSQLLGYELVTFHTLQTVQGAESPIYHTNVMMHVGTDIAIICLESIATEKERLTVKDHLIRSGKLIIPITVHQKYAFAGNMLEVKNARGEKFTVMSRTAFDHLKIAQKQAIMRFTKIIAPPLPLIEKLGGGSARCMLAEIFLPSAY